MKFNTIIAKAITFYNVPNATNEYFKSFAMPKDSTSISMTDGNTFVFFGDNKIKSSSSIKSKLNLFESHNLYSDDFILANAKKESYFEINIEPKKTSELKVPEMVLNSEVIGYCNFASIEKIIKTLKISGASGVVRLALGTSANDDFKALVFRLKTGGIGNEIPTECAIYLQNELTQNTTEAKIEES